MKQILVYCDGGLSNRFGTVIGATWLANKLGASIKVYWPETKWCDCPLGDLITNYDSINLNLGSLFNDNEISYYITHIPKNNLIPSTHPNDIFKVDFSPYTVIAYNADYIPTFLFGTQDLYEIINSWNINKKILDVVSTFIEKYELDNTVRGVHLRKTDMSVRLDENYIEDVIRANEDQRFFVCSDDLETENRFKKLDNVITFDKTHYVEKVKSESNWEENVYRGKESVIQAFIDLLLLSRTTLTFKNPNSTFSLFAEIFNFKIQL